MSEPTPLELMMEERDVYREALRKIAAHAGFELAGNQIYAQGSADAFDLLAAIAQEALDTFEEQTE